MRLSGLSPLIEADIALDRLTGSVASGRSGVCVAPKGARPALIAAAARYAQSAPLVVITATSRDAQRLTAALQSWIDGVVMMPAWETLPHERLSPQVDTMTRRIAVLRRLAHPEPGDPYAGPISVLVMPVRAFVQPVISGLGDIEPVRLRARDQVDLTDLSARLVALGYERVDMVESRGQMSVRGGIIDVFPPQEPHPVRIELWGDEVDEVRAFSVQDQRTLGVLAAGLWAPACRELLLTDAVRARARDLSCDLPGAAQMLSLAGEGIAAPGIESLAPLLSRGMERLIDLLPPGSPIFSVDPERVRARASDLIATTAEFLEAAWSAAAGGGQVPIEVEKASFLSFDELRQNAANPWWDITQLPPPELADATESSGDEDSFTAVKAVAPSPTLMRMGARDVRPYKGDFAAASADIARLVKDGWTIAVTTPGPGPAKRMRTILAQSGVPATYVDDVDEVPTPGSVIVTTAQAEAGFVAPELRFALLTESDITGRVGASTRDMRKMPSRRRRGIDPLTLHPGDFIVHEQHGIGRFIEVVSRTIGRPGAGVTRDYLVVEYAPSKRGQPADRLYVPTDALDQISQYTGSDQPALSKMGGADWAKAKARAKKAVNEVAKELIRLYAVRQATKGRAFGPDTPWQRELEDAFPYVETPDQLVTIDEVKADMEKPVPMDRLLTGDVGYGKTEIAVRAAFKAIQDGAQVAVLVPTTLLVRQHVETFTERYAGFPVTIASLSRFSTPKETEAVKEGLSSGKIDLVIGTHSLLTGTVAFKNLGLVVIDEEQRFGVEHKETLKALRTDVDVLSMSATPIPRTLEMAVSGIREMSILQTPPEERQPVLTFVGAYTDAQVIAAIRRELLRDGQVFFVHNRVESINSVAAHIQSIVPQARVRVAHGKLPEQQLEEVMVDFWNHEFDVLVCTTIVETGLDIANANTLIVDRADAFGLSQLHQLRGRVGRGAERAYAYFFYPGDKALTQTAHERLKTIAANTHLGAGLAVAQKDLEIRGAGNLLGGAQSGHIDGVGFDLYVRMVADAVAMFKGEVPAEKPALRLDIPVDAHIPDSYVPGERLRLEVYGKIASVDNAEHESDIREELADRYGPIPREVDLLFAVARLREVLRTLGITEVQTQGKYVRISPVELRQSQVLRLKRLHPGTVMKTAVRQVLVPMPKAANSGLGSAAELLTDEPFLEWLETLVTKILTPFAP